MTAPRPFLLTLRQQLLSRGNLSVGDERYLEDIQARLDAIDAPVLGVLGTYHGYDVLAHEPGGSILLAVPTQPTSPDGEDDEDDLDVPSVAALRADLELAAEDVRPRTRAADLRAQLEESLEDERREAERAAQAQLSRDSFEVDEAQRARHREAVAAAGWRYCAAVARHEAGHVVAGVCEEARGGARLVGARFGYAGDRISEAETVFESSPSPLVLAAGAAAGLLLRGQNEHGGHLSPGDRERLERQGIRGHRPAELVQLAAGALGRHVDAVQRIADVLFRDGVISADTARAIVAGKHPRPTPAGNPSEVLPQVIPWGRPAPSWQEAAW